MTRNHQTQKCPECKSRNLIERRDEQFAVCQDCGFVMSSETAKIVANGKIKRDQHNLIQRTCSPVKAPLAIEDKETNHEHIAQVFEQLRQVKIWDSTEKNLATALQYITRTAVDLSLPSTALEKATLTYKRIIQKGLLKGRAMKAVCATAIYIGSKQSETAITIRDIAHFTRLNPREISHNYRSICKHLEVSVRMTSVNNCASEIATRLQLSIRTKELAEKILEASNSSKSFAGKAPTGIVCAAIYISSSLNGEKRTQREIAEAARITETTIRSRIRELERDLIFSFRL
jgi:transcription initiation factor TFIIB